MKSMVAIRILLSLATAAVLPCLRAFAAAGAETQDVHSSAQAPLVEPIPSPPGDAAEGLVAVDVRQFHMGMIVRLTVWAPTREEGRAASRRAFTRVGDLDRVFSDYDPHSELSALCRRAGEGPVPVSRELYEVLDLALQFAEESGGAYDPTAGPLTELWREARRQRKLPSGAARDEARRRVDYRAVTLDPDARTATLARPGIRLDLGAIAKGFIGDEIVGALRSEGLPRVAFEAGGDMVFGDAPPGEEGWPVEAFDPVPGAPLHLAHCAISVSGDTVQFVEIDGRRYSHVVHARTGRAVTNRQACVVIAPAGRHSDPLATLGTILTPGQFRSLLSDHHPGVRARIRRIDTGEGWRYGEFPRGK